MSDICIKIHECITQYVTSYSQNAVDLGGPRKEFFRLVLLEIKEKYFDDGIRDLLATDYKIVGIIFGLSLSHNDLLSYLFSFVCKIEFISLSLRWFMLDLYLCSCHWNNG